MRGRLAAATACAILAACGGATAAPSTTVVPTTAAPSTTVVPTTAAPSTTVVPTTAAPSTTVVPTTAAPSRDGAAKQAVTDRYLEYTNAATACIAAPTACDAAQVLGEYAEPDSVLYQVYENWWKLAIEKQETYTKLDRQRVEVADVQLDGLDALLIGCVVDGLVRLGPDGKVVDDNVGYRLEETMWRLVDGQWRLVGGGNVYKLDADSENSFCAF